METNLQNELLLLEAGIRKTAFNLAKFEEKYGMQTSHFITAFENDEIEETIDIAEWVGEYRMLTRLKEKSTLLRKTQIENFKNSVS